jgi:thiamine pyrophosphokinase
MNIPISFPNIQLCDIPAKYPSSPPKGDEEIGVFTNGVLSLDHLGSLVERISECSGILLVDGGANSFCKLLQECQKQKLATAFRLLSIVGDLDSIEEASLQMIQTRYPNIEIIKFDRAKDFTDLEAALKLIKIDLIARVTIFNALGGRIDQTLANILYLFRKAHHLKVKIETHSGGWGFKETLHVSPVEFTSSIKSPHMTPIPLYGSEKETLHVVHDYFPKAYGLPEEESLNYVFGQQANVVQDLQVILHCASHPGGFTIRTPDETVFAIPPNGKLFSFNALAGQTISLIPLGGPACGIHTEGLHWSLNDGTLDKDFMGISNIAISKKISISVKKGVLLCVVNNFIDSEMLSRVQQK